MRREEPARSPARLLLLWSCLYPCPFPSLPLCSVLASAPAPRPAALRRRPDTSRRGAGRAADRGSALSTRTSAIFNRDRPALMPAVDRFRTRRGPSIARGLVVVGVGGRGGGQRRQADAAAQGCPGPALVLSSLQAARLAPRREQVEDPTYHAIAKQPSSARRCGLVIPSPPLPCHFMPRGGDLPCYVVVCHAIRVLRGCLPQSQCSER